MTEQPALLIIDMVKDYFKDENHYPITPLARKIIPNEFADQSFDQRVS